MDLMTSLESMARSAGRQPSGRCGGGASRGEATGQDPDTRMFESYIDRARTLQGIRGGPGGAPADATPEGPVLEAAAETAVIDTDFDAPRSVCVLAVAACGELCLEQTALDADVSVALDVSHEPIAGEAADVPPDASGDARSGCIDACDVLLAEAVGADGLTGEVWFSSPAGDIACDSDADATDAAPPADADATDAAPPADADAMDAAPPADTDATDIASLDIAPLDHADPADIVLPDAQGMAAEVPQPDMGDRARAAVAPADVIVTSDHDPEGDKAPALPAAPWALEASRAPAMQPPESPVQVAVEVKDEADIEPASIQDGAQPVAPLLPGAVTATTALSDGETPEGQRELSPDTASVLPSPEGAGVDTAQMGATSRAEQPAGMQADNQVEVPADRAMTLAQVAAGLDRLVAQAVRADNHMMRVDIEPANLGRLTVLCRETTAGLSIEIAVREDAVRTLLSGLEQDVRQTLESQGIQVGRFQVSCQDGDGRARDRQAEAHAFSPRGTVSRAQAVGSEETVTGTLSARMSDGSWRNRWVA